MGGRLTFGTMCAVGMFFLRNHYPELHVLALHKDAWAVD